MCAPDKTVDSLVRGVDELHLKTDEAQVSAHWRSEECLRKLDSSFVSRGVLERWAREELPTDRPELTMGMQQSRHFYLQLLQRNNANTFHNSWAKACALLDVTMLALIEKKSPLVQDLVLVTTVVLGIARKDETSAASGCYHELLRVAATFEDHLHFPRQERTTKSLKNAEFEIFDALEWSLPQTDTYTCISAILLRTDILTKGDYKPQLEAAWQQAVHKCVRSVIWGMATGYATAHAIVYESLQDVGFDPDFLELLFAEAAPEPKFQAPSEFEPPKRVSASSR
jgi:hypothetical protein